jgi:hypothetical protein
VLTQSRNVSPSHIPYQLKTFLPPVARTSCYGERALTRLKPLVVQCLLTSRSQLAQGLVYVMHIGNRVEAARQFVRQSAACDKLTYAR